MPVTAISASLASVCATALRRNTPSTPSNTRRTVAGSSRFPCTAVTPFVSFSFAGSRVSTLTSAPRATSSFTTADPTVPVPPVTRMFISRSYTTRGPRSRPRSSAGLVPHLRGGRPRGVLELLDSLESEALPERRGALHGDQLGGGQPVRAREREQCGDEPRRETASAMALADGDVVDIQAVRVRRQGRQRRLQLEHHPGRQRD